jgi:3-dehydroquinate synthase
MKYAIITDHTVAKLYGRKFNLPIFSFPPGEAYKTRTTKEALEDGLIEAGFSRDTTIIGLGGGVVTDMAGFLAATFCRGVPLILIPTTLMGMVDAAIGGKNAVNTPLGKNMIGTLYSPQHVWVDPRFLQTLPEPEMWCGRVEILKAGLIADPDLLEIEDLDESIFAAIEVKRRIIARDLVEDGVRRLLNFGHTVGHALETLSNYAIPHGEAVATGIVVESRLSYQMGILDQRSLEKIEALFPPPSVPFDPEDMMRVFSRDKKSVGGVPRFVLLKTIGVPSGCAPVPQPILYKVLHDAAVCSCRS